jgi:osmotically-inducible protein OsmY
VKALAIDVTTEDGHVTLTGSVRSAAERERALALARETAGVKSVRDQLRMR